MRAQTAFTLIELLVVLALLGVFAGVALPAFAELAERQRVTTWSRDFGASLNLAREQAVRSGHRVRVCSSADGRACSEGAAVDWTQGWLVFEDIDNDGRCVDAQGRGICDGDGGRVFRVHAGIDGERFQVVANRHAHDSVRYLSNGSSAGHTGRFTLCRRADATPVAGLVLANTGRLRLDRPAGYLACQ